MPLQLSGTSGVLDNSGAFIAGTAVASTSGTSIDFTSIPSWVKRITVMFSQVSLNGNSEIMIQIGDSGGIETTGYRGVAGFSGASGGSYAFSIGFVTFTDGSAGDDFQGQAVLSLLNSSTNTWAYSGNFANYVSYTTNGGGAKSLSGTLDRVRITAVNGTDAFDAGSINILYE